VGAPRQSSCDEQLSLQGQAHQAPAQLAAALAHLLDVLSGVDVRQRLLADCLHHVLHNLGLLAGGVRGLGGEQALLAQGSHHLWWWDMMCMAMWLRGYTVHGAEARDVCGVLELRVLRGLEDCKCPPKSASPGKMERLRGGRGQSHLAKLGSVKGVEFLKAKYGDLGGEERWALACLHVCACVLACARAC